MKENMSWDSRVCQLQVLEGSTLNIIYLKPTDSLGCWFLSNPECAASNCQDARCIGFLQLGVGLLLRDHRHLRSNPEQLKRCVQTRHPPVKLCLSKLNMGKSECCQLEYLRVSQCRITTRHHLYTPSLGLASDGRWFLWNEST